MVEPTSFFLNEETFEDNKFMQKTKDSKKQTTQKAIQEFKNMEANLRKAGVKVATYKQQKPTQPDAIFPNNWFSTHKNDIIPEGLFLTYPMKAPSRQAEYNPQIVKEIGK